MYSPGWWDLLVSVLEIHYFKGKKKRRSSKTYLEYLSQSFLFTSLLKVLLKQLFYRL